MLTCLGQTQLLYDGHEMQHVGLLKMCGKQHPLDRLDSISKIDEQLMVFTAKYALAYAVTGVLYI